VALVGDGGFSMLMAEFATAVKYQLPIKVVLLNHHTLGQIKSGLAEDTVATVSDPAHCGRVMDEAAAVPGPVLIDAVVDPYEPPVPPSVTADQATKFAESLAKGEPNRKKIVLTVLEDRVRELIQECQ